MGEFYIGAKVIDQDGMWVINDAGMEEFIPPDRLWEWEHDARSDSISPEDFDALYDPDERLLREAGGEA